MLRSKRIALITAITILVSSLCHADQLSPAVQTGLTPAEMRHTANTLKSFFVPFNPDNLTGKSYRDWTSRDLERVGPRDLQLFRFILAEEQYSISDELLPRGMTREDFNSNILREMARRKIVQDEYVVGIFPLPNQRSQEVNVMRAAYTYTGQNAFGEPTPVRGLAGVIAMHDAAVDMFLNNPSGLRVQKDVAAATGISDNGVVSLRTDVAAYDAGYMAGAMAGFRNADALNIKVNSPLSPQEFQAKFCPVMHTMFQDGRAFDNRDSFATGFVQARVDAKTGFEPITDHVGVLEQCS